MPPRAPQFGDRARFGVLVGPSRYWAGRAGVGINPVMTKQSSEDAFYRKALSGGQAPAGPRLPPLPSPQGPRTTSSPSYRLGLWVQYPRWPLEGSSAPPFPGCCPEAVHPPTGVSHRHPLPKTHTDGTGGPIGHLPVANLGPPGGTYTRGRGREPRRRASIGPATGVLGGTLQSTTPKKMPSRPCEAVAPPHPALERELPGEGGPMPPG